MIISRGQQGAVENYEEISWSQQAGYTRRGAYEGPKASVKALLSELQAAGLSFVYVCDRNPNATVRYESPGQTEGGGGGTETPSVIWELFSARIEVDLLAADLSGQHGTMNLNGISTAEREQLRKKLDRDSTFTAPASPSAAFTAALEVIAHGGSAFRVHVPVVRVSRLVSNNYSVAVSQSNVGRIFTTATLATVEATPPVLFEFQDFSQQSGRAGWSYGWYKNFPNVQQSGSNRWQISQEWEFNLWAVAAHGSAL